MKHTQHFFEQQAKFRLQRNWRNYYRLFLDCITALIFLGISSCTHRSRQDALWYTAPHRNTFILRTIQGDVLDSTMTVELQRSFLLTTTTVNGARSVRNELIRVLPNGLSKVLVCNSSSIDQATAEALFYARPARDTTTILRACTGDTVNIFYLSAHTAQLDTYYGSLSARIVRELDKTGIIVDYHINETFGIVRIDFLRARFDSTTQQYVADSTAQLSEQAVLRTHEQLQQRPAP